MMRALPLLFVASVGGYSSRGRGCLAALRSDPQHQHQRSSSPAANKIRLSSASYSRSRVQCENSKNCWSVEECIQKRDSIRFIDGSWYHEGIRNGRQEFLKGPRIPGAQYWDMDDIATSQELYPQDNPKGLRVMFPPKSLIAATLQAMNIRSNVSRYSRDPPKDQQEEDPIVVYGRQGCIFTPRIWYILKTFGHSKVGLMQGSLEDWIKEGGPVDTMSLTEREGEDWMIHANKLVTTPEYQSFREHFQSNLGGDKLDRLLTMKDVLEHLLDRESSSSDVLPVLIDTRGADNFSKGHVPGAISIPYKLLVEPGNPLVLKPRKELEKVVAPLLVGLRDREQSWNTETNCDSSALSPQVWLSCGSGVSVCHLALVLEELGFPQKPYIYDGSWNEWGSNTTTPKEVGL